MVKSSNLMKGKRCGVAGDAPLANSGYHVVCTKRPDAPDISLAKN
jgi:hypothetical protein